MLMTTLPQGTIAVTKFRFLFELSPLFFKKKILKFTFVLKD